MTLNSPQKELASVPTCLLERHASALDLDMILKLYCDYLRLLP